jgi:serine/threonine protein kinase
MGQAAFFAAKNAETVSASASASGSSGGDAELLPRGTAIGRYVVLAQLGMGGMGVVYSAYDYGLDRRVALKFLRSTGGDGRRREEQLLGEAQAMARLSHPNVIVVHDVDRFGERVFFAMEYVDGQTLGAWLRARPRSTREILRVFTDAGRGLAAAHAAGIVHGDFKPENVLVAHDGRVRVTDFGLAHSISGECGGGTPGYSAPELKRGCSDARSDQFSFGVALAEALFGNKRRYGASEAPSGGRVPGHVARALERAVREEPDQRYGSMDELLAALSRPSPPAWARWVRPAASSAVLAAVVTLVGHSPRGRTPMPLAVGSSFTLPFTLPLALVEPAALAALAVPARAADAPAGTLSSEAPRPSAPLALPSSASPIVPASELHAAPRPPLALEPPVTGEGAPRLTAPEPWMPPLSGPLAFTGAASARAAGTPWLMAGAAVTHAPSQGEANAPVPAPITPGPTTPSSAAPGASQLAGSPSYALLATSADGHAIVYDTQSLETLSISSSGAPSPISRGQLLADLPSVMTVGRLAFVWHDGELDAAQRVTRRARLSAWSPELGALELSDRSFPYVAAASSDGQFMAWVGNVQDGTGDLLVDTVPPSGPRMLVSGLVLDGKQRFCTPQLTFLQGRLVESHCTDASGAGLVQSFDLASGQAVTLLQPAWNGFQPDPSQTRALLWSTDGTAQLVPVNGGAAEWTSPGIGQALFTAQSLLYVSFDAELMRRSLTGLGTPEVKTHHLAYAYAASPDGRYVLGASIFSPIGAMDLLLVDALVPGAPVQLAPRGAMPIGFTQDSEWVIYLASYASPYGALQARRVDRRGTITLSSRAWGALAVGPGRVLFVDNTDDPNVGALMLVDLSGGCPTVRVSGAVSGYLLAPDGKSVLYTSIGDDTDPPGLFAASLPADCVSE